MPPVTVLKNLPGCICLPKRIIIAIICFISYFPAQAQQELEDKLILQLNAAKSDSERIVRLGHLSQYYNATKEFTKTDSLIEKQIMVAEATMNQRLVLMAYFGNVGYNTQGVARKDRSRKSEEYTRRALEYAKANDMSDYVAMAYSNLASINNTDGKLDEAFKNANLAYATALNTENDSAIVISAIELGNTYQQRSDILMAYKTFINAQNTANQNNRETLLPQVYHAIARMYKKLDKNETAKKYIHQSLAINKKVKNITGQIDDYIFLAKVNNYIAGKNYLQEAVSLADQIENVSLKIEAERILFSHMLFEEKPSYIIAYLEGNPELKNVFINSGPDYINWMYAEIYHYGGQNDSALHYFKKAETSFNTGYDMQIKKGFFGELASCYQALNNIPQAIVYYQKSYDLSKATYDLRGIKLHTYVLKDLYHQQGNFEQAYNYSLLHDHYKDSLELLGRERDLVLMEIDNVTKQQQRAQEIATEKVRRKHNLQYMLITIIVACVFVLLIMVGMFRVSAVTIRLMGFLSLIFFFEFVILILDHWIHNLTHGEPWKVWLIKIGIISILLPVHHFMEHKLIRYLLSRHLITVRSRLSTMSLFRKKKKLLAEQEALEEALEKEENIV